MSDNKPDTYEFMREVLDIQIQAQREINEWMQKLLSPESGFLRGSPDSQAAKIALRNWFRQQCEINERVGQILTILDSRIRD